MSNTLGRECPAAWQCPRRPCLQISPLPSPQEEEERQQRAWPQVPDLEWAAQGSAAWHTRCLGQRREVPQIPLPPPSDPGRAAGFLKRLMPGPEGQKGSLPEMLSMVKEGTRLSCVTCSQVVFPREAVELQHVPCVLCFFPHG